MSPRPPGTAALDGRSAPEVGGLPRTKPIRNAAAFRRAGRRRRGGWAVRRLVENDTDSEAEILSFVRGAISSICALELLILLRRERAKVWRTGELVRELRSSSLAVTHALDRLSQTGLVEEVPELGYRYRPDAAQLDAICQRLETEYARRPVTVVRAILDAPNEKLRIFADAFRLSGRNK